MLLVAIFPRNLPLCNTLHSSCLLLPKVIVEMSMKTYDVIILGASGFTGKYVVREALKFLNTPNSPLKSLALAGRSPSRLSEALKWASSGVVWPPKVPLISADTTDPDSLSRLANQAKLILNCVGPFHLYGPPVIEACVEAGCDYLDICGEPHFMETMEVVYHDRALEKGSLVVPACGFDSVPAEMGLIFHSKHWAGPLLPNHVDAYLTLESDKKIVFNTATYESAVVCAANAYKLWRRRSRPTRARPAIPRPAPLVGSLIAHQKELGLWGLKLPTADAAIVRRTLSCLAENPQGLPGMNESVQHVLKRENFWSSVKPAHFNVKLGSKSLLGFLHLIGLGAFLGLLSQFSLGRRLLLKFPFFFSFGWFRKKGPSEDEVVSATFKMWFVGRGFSDAKLALQENEKPNTEIITRVMGPEVGYLSTPIILLQCALIILTDRDNLPKGGVYPPGIVFGPTGLQERLQQNGISFDFISKKIISE